EPLSGERLKQFEDDRIQELQATGILEQRELSREQLEATIQSLEKELGIESPLDRVVEAGLLIDKKFLDTALITGQDRAVERMFGDAAWADWLSARVDAKYYSGEPLSADFIKSLHSSLAKYSNRELGGIIRKNGILGGDYKDLGRPVTYTAEQLTAIADQGHCILNLTKRSFLVDDEIT
ncbi:MAG TPA: hypothetical protein VFI15_10975, partial [Candidatus Limnocylindrales bacterium]|nr:hypothetical protein [Candidatus Limnocylindrales bacterium]